MVFKHYVFVTLKQIEKVYSSNVGSTDLIYKAAELNKQRQFVNILCDFSKKKKIKWFFD